MDIFRTLDIDTITLLMALMIFMLTAISWHRNDSQLNLQSIVAKNGEFSLSKIGQFTALIVSTWIAVYETRHGRMTEFLFTGYMLAWAGTNMASKFLDKKAKPDDSHDSQAKE